MMERKSQPLLPSTRLALISLSLSLAPATATASARAAVFLIIKAAAYRE